MSVKKFLLILDSSPRKPACYVHEQIDLKAFSALLQNASEENIYIRGTLRALTRFRQRSRILTESVAEQCVLSMPHKVVLTFAGFCR